MAGSDLDVVIRSIAKKQIKTLTDAAKERYGRLMAMAAKAKDKETKDHYKHIAKNTLLLAGAAARRLLITADSFARSIKKAEEEKVVAKPPQKEPAKKQPAKEATKKEPAQKEPAKKEPVKQEPTKKQPAKKEAARKQKS
jgi:outer membrane biosynthesis protein TonB